MKNLFSFSRRDRNGLMLLMILIISATGVASLFSYRSSQEKKKQQEFLISSSRYLAELQVVGIEPPGKRSVKLPVISSYDHTEEIENEPQKEEIHIIEINSADSANLISLPGIGKVFASRIIKYRNMLGGYYNPEQLKEVYGFNDEKYQNLKAYISVDTSLISKLNINKAEFQTVLKHPYIDYDMTKRIFKARNKTPFVGSEDLSQRASIPDSIIVKVDNYLVYY